MTALFTPARDDAVTPVLGAILVLAVIASALVYFNAFVVPEQGAALERAQARGLAAETDRLAALAASHANAPSATTLTVAPTNAAPPLVRGLVLAPRDPSATMTFEPDATRLRLSHVVAGVRTFDIGSAADPLDIGRLTTTTSGNYIASQSFSVENGAAARATGTDTHLTLTPDWSGVTENGTRVVRLKLVQFVGDPAGLTGADARTVRLDPVATGTIGGRTAAATEIKLEVWSADASAWGAFMNATFAPDTAVVTGGATPSAVATLTGAPLGLEATFVRHRLTVS